MSSSSTWSAPSSSSLTALGLLLGLSLGACGGATTIAVADPAPPDAPPQSAATPEPAATPKPPPRTQVIPPSAVTPFTGKVGTTDVSILYPLPLASLPDMIAASDVGNHGALFPEGMFDTVLGGGRLEQVSAEHPSGHAALRLVGLRLDPCGGEHSTEKCVSEVRAVFQAVYATPTGLAATDGALHVSYDVTRDELVTITKEILTLKLANGDLALNELAPHPILSLQGTSGAFAVGLRNIVLFHLGEDRVGRVTFFDHNFTPDSDGWQFGFFARTGGGALAARQIPTLSSQGQMVFGSAADAPEETTHAGTFDGTLGPDSVLPLFDDAETPSTAQRAAFDAALRMQDPTRTVFESASCANCHLAEGARRVGEKRFGLVPAAGKEFTSARSLLRVDERTSATNLHAFGYLGTKVAIMQRTANESAHVAELLEEAVGPSK